VLSDAYRVVISIGRFLYQTVRNESVPGGGMHHWLHGRSTDSERGVMETIHDILVVDDDSATVDFVIEALNEEGYLCCAAYDGESGLLAITTARPALVLLDFHLPGLSGIDVVAQLRAHDLGHVPVVLMTADATAIAQLSMTMFPEYILKPFALDTLLECVARYVRPQLRHTRPQTTHPTIRTSTDIR
jgi:DNA-binding response OmpR family regulator